MRRAAVLGVIVAALAAPDAHAASWTALVSEEAHFVSSPPSGGSLGAIDLGASPPVGSSPIGVPNPFEVALSPDANTAYVGSAEGCGQSTANQVLPVDLHFSPPVAGAPIALGAVGAFGLVGSPDGRTLFASGCGKVVPIDVSVSPPVLKPAIDVGADAFELVVSRDGRTLWTANHGAGTVSVVDLSAATPATVKTITVGQQPLGMALTPNGAKLYVANGKDCTISVVDTATETAGTTPIALPAAACAASPQGFFGDPGRIVLSPDGATLYAASFDAQVVTPIATATDTPGTPISFTGVTTSTGPFRPGGMAVTPDGSRLLVADAGSSGGQFGHTVQIVSTPANTLSGAPIDLHSQLGFGTDAAVTPDQAPAADFAVTSAPPGAESSFDASASTVRFGTIASYTWDFGDGTPVKTTATPQTTHTYASAGTFSASVTATSGAGTGLPATTLTAGRTLVRRGSDGARMTRTVAVANGPAPAVSLSPAALDFGAIGVGKPSDSRTVTLTNTGGAPLHVSSITVSGDFSATGCDDHTLAAGAACDLSVTFTPTAASARTGSLTVADDATGSPHAIPLSGTGDTSGVVTGTVRDTAAPLRSAYVTLCTIALSGCRGAITDADGHYRFASVKPGSYIATIYPPGGTTLGQGTRLADVAAGQTVDATTVLRRPAGVPAGLELSTPSGPFNGNLYWGDPFGVTLPLKPLGANGPPGKQVATTVFVTLTTAGTGQLVTGSAITYVVHYDADGRADHATEADTPLPGALAEGFHFALGGVATRPGQVTTLPTGSAAAATRLVAQSDGLQQRAHGALELSVGALRSPAATTRRTDFCDLHVPYLPQEAQRVLEDAAALDEVRREIDDDKARDGSVAPSLLAEQERLRAELQAAEETYNRDLQLVDEFCTPTPPCDDNIFSNEVPCPTQAPMAVDPSGFVRTRKGVPLEKAKVVLQRSDAAKGPFAALPKGDGRMAPNNRRNPDRTDIDGHFGWDVFPGYYRVRATRGKCRGHALTKGLPVPPPVTDLDLRLSCPGLRRAASHTRVLAVRRRGPASVVVVRVGGRRTPSGLVRVAGRFGFLRRGRVAVAVPGHPKHVKARYAGNARWAPSHS